MPRILVINPNSSAAVTSAIDAASGRPVIEPSQQAAAAAIAAIWLA